MGRGVLLLAGLAGLLLRAGDTNCPAYPYSDRVADAQHRAAERTYAHFSLEARSRPAPRTTVTVPPSVNFIDDFIFGRMAQDGVQPAPLSSDAEFLRRISLDLTGRIPTPDQVTSFLQNADPTKRSQLIDQLMASDAFIDHWTQFYANLFQVTSAYYNFISIPGRNKFNGYLRDFIQNDRSYQDVSREIISAAGDATAIGPANFSVRSVQQGDPIQDTWDTLTDAISVSFLGTKTICISCHDGRGHLEQINLFLSTHKRVQFWQQSAFLSRTQFDFIPLDAFHQENRSVVVDRTAGDYSSVVNANNPGPRPPRYGGPYTPSYLYTGDTPQTGNWRSELARLVTSDRQFARAATNYLWAAMFTYGIVDPPGAFDMARIDPSHPPADGVLQPTDPKLMEALATEFIKSNYSIRHMIQLMANSNAYQLTSNYGPSWNVAYQPYFAKHFSRRLSAEELYDAVTDATLSTVPMYLDGYDQPLYHAGQLPDPTEPRNNYQIWTFLQNFGRGDYWNVTRNSTSTVLQVLYLMNDNFVNFRTFGARNGSWNTRVAQLLQSTPDDQTAVRQLFLATLSRPASDAELAAAMSARNLNGREQWLSDVQWALLNKLDFMFSY
ncbi:MAG: DUF1553 domain-containing protein [Acidobacteriia bacterium]|nr:DUF1553 domain-containing protein [Terriglobia bacterium]